MSRNRIISLAIGWLCGNFITAQAVALKKTGKCAARVGRTGNPGMANIMEALGLKCGIAVLVGDILKTLLAMAICACLFPTQSALIRLPSLAAAGFIPGNEACFWAGCGATLGHNFPLLSGLILNLIYRRNPSFSSKDLRTFYHGGKGVTTTCAALILYSPVWGLLSAIAGMIVVFITRYLCVGAVVIPAVFCLPAFLIYGPVPGWISVFLTLLMFSRHYSALRLVPSGQAHKNDVIGAIRKKLSQNRAKKR